MTANTLTESMIVDPDGCAGDGDRAGDVRVDILATNLDEAGRRINAANRRLDRAGIDGRFTYSVEHYEAREVVAGVTVITPRVELALNVPALSFGGWTFQASLDIVEGQVIVSTAPNADLSNWERPDAHHCDHCGLNRRRTHSYALRNDDTGEIRQVGRSCLELFLGVRPAGLWALQWGLDELDDLTGDDEFGVFLGSQVPTHFDPRQILALATVLSERGRAFVSRQRAREWETCSTSDDVAAVLLPSANEPPSVRQWRQETLIEAAGVDSAEIDAMINSVADLGDSDYAQNLQALASVTSIPVKHVALWASLVAVYFREVARKEVDDALPPLTGTYFAEPEEKITEVTGTVTTLTSWESYFGYRPKIVTLMVVHTDCGHLLKWQGAVPSEVDGQPLEKRQRITITRATVKSHEEYKGNVQTRIVRAKLARPADN